MTADALIYLELGVLNAIQILFEFYMFLFLAN
jgi:hypothetical protein